eukprot:2180267-Rhodomonas_salina.1
MRKPESCSARASGPPPCAAARAPAVGLRRDTSLTLTRRLSLRLRALRARLRLRLPRRRRWRGRGGAPGGAGEGRATLPSHGDRRCTGARATRAEGAESERALPVAGPGATSHGTRANPRLGSSLDTLVHSLRSHPCSPQAPRPRSTGPAL